METDQLLELCKATDAMGYSGIYVSDHIFYPRHLASRYTYSPYEDGSPIWSAEANWPDTWCLIAAMAAITTTLHFTSGVYIAPARDLFTVAKQVGTAAFISHNRVHLGVGVGWCKEEFQATGQDFHNRGSRLDDMIPALRTLWQGGWVEYHGSHYDFDPLQMNPSPTAPVPIYGGGHSEPAMRRAARLCDGWLCANAYAPDEAWTRLDQLKGHLKAAKRKLDSYRIYMALAVMPDVELFKRFEDAGVTDMICAPWMLAEMSQNRDYRSDLEAKLKATEEFASNVIAKM
ncbi:MAG: TIGR03619 family F420-dependent LLM class oxidoreductase [Acidimicrobiales bacterium]